MSSVKYNPNRFKTLILKKIRDNGYTSVRDAAKKNSFPRNPLARAMVGQNRPSVESLERWSKALNCTPAERTELYHSIGLLTPDEQEEEERPVCAA